MKISLKIIFAMVSSGFIFSSALADSTVDISICNALKYDSTQYPNGHRILYILAPLDARDLEQVSGSLSSTVVEHDRSSAPSCRAIQFSTKQAYPITSNLIISDEETGIVLWAGKVKTTGNNMSYFTKINSGFDTKEEIISIETTPTQITVKGV